MMNSSRASDTNSDARYGYESYNITMNNLGNGSQYNQGNNYNAPQPNFNNYGQYGYSNYDKTFSIVTTEPVTIKQNQPLIIVDPIIEEHVNSYLTWSICNIIFCCLIGGIVTTVFSFRVRKLNDDEKFNEARKMAAKVELANMIVSGAGALIFILVFPYIYLAIYPYLPKINY